MSRHAVLIVIGAIVLATAAFSGGCDSEAKTDALIGTAIGAGIGQLAGGDTEATMIGAGVGAGAGYIVGNEADKKKAQQPTVTSTVPAQEEIVVMVLNSNGSKTPVKLHRSGSVYIGPKGEQYDTLPTSEQLRPAYGF